MRSEVDEVIEFVKLGEIMVVVMSVGGLGI